MELRQKLKVKICLVNPSDVSKTQPPLNLAYLAAYLRQYGENNYEIKIADENVGHNSLKIIKTFKPDIVGISVNTYQLIRAKEIVAKVKRLDNRVLTIIGGVHVTALPELTLRTTDFDIAVIREGEETFRQLVDAYISQGGALPPESLSKIKGIAYKWQGKISVNDERAFIENLDSIPLPARDLLDMDSYLKPGIVIKGSPPVRATTILSSRGCPYNCVFCGSPYMSQRKMRFRSPESIVFEIKYLVDEYKIKAFYIVDDIFVLNKAKVKRTCELLIESGLSERVVWSCQGRANIMTEKDLDLYQLLRKAGCVQLEFGFESGCDRVLGFLKDHSVTVSQNQAAIDIANKANLRVVGFFMIGTPGESEREMLETKDFILRNLKKLSFFQIGYTVPYPGTKLWELYGLDKLDEEVTEKLWRGYVPQLKFPSFLEPYSSATNINLRAARKIERAINVLAATRAPFKFKVARTLWWLRYNPRGLIIVMLYYLKEKLTHIFQK